MCVPGSVCHHSHRESLCQRENDSLFWLGRLAHDSDICKCSLAPGIYARIASNRSQALFTMTTTLLIIISLAEIRPPGVANPATVDGILTVCFSYTDLAYHIANLITVGSLHLWSIHPNHHHLQAQSGSLLPSNRQSALAASSHHWISILIHSLRNCLAFRGHLPMRQSW
jgi:hypothetical protein